MFEFGGCGLAGDDVESDLQDLFSSIRGGADLGPEIQWETVELPTSLGDHFRDLAPQPIAPSVEHLKDPSKCTPAALLQYAVFKDNPERFFPRPKFARNKIRGKGPDKKKTGYVLHQLQLNYRFEIDWDDHDWESRRNACYEYQHDFSEVTGMPHLEAKKSSREHWGRADKAERKTWAFVSHLRAQIYVQPGRGMKRVLREPAVSDAVTTPLLPQAEHDPLIGQACGLLRTHHTDLHNQHPEIAQICLQKVPLKERLRQLMQIPALEQMHKEHDEAVAAQAKRLGFKMYATTMELCMNSKDNGRIHLHDYQGGDVSHGVDDSICKKVDIRVSDVYFQGRRGHHALTRGRGIKGIRDATALGLYYVACNKIGTIFTTTTREPFEDDF